MDGDWGGAVLLAEDERYRDVQRLYEGGLSTGRRRHVDHGLSPKALKKLDRIFESILQHGYRSQQELLQIDRGATRRLNNDTLHPAFNEIGVNVYRDGTLVRAGGGFHRLALASALGIPSVPVVVRVRHAAWEAVRRGVAGANSVGALSPAALAHLEHPDLADVVPPSWLSRPPAPT